MAVSKARDVAWNGQLADLMIAQIPFFPRISEITPVMPPQGDLLSRRFSCQLFGAMPPARRLRARLDCQSKIANLKS